MCSDLCKEHVWDNWWQILMVLFFISLCVAWIWLVISFMREQQRQIDKYK